MRLLLATISFFMCFRPRRDTQANAFSDYGSVVLRPLLMLCILSNMSILSWIQATTNTLIFCEGESSIALDFSFGRVFAVLVPFLFLRIMTISLSCVLDLGYTCASALCDTCTTSSWEFDRTSRKHGCWKSRLAFPTAWTLLSFVALSPTQVASFTHHRLHLAMTMHPSSVAC